MSDNSLTPVSIVDKNGKKTTVHKKAEDVPTKNKRAGAMGAPNAFESDRVEFLSEIESELDAVQVKISALDEEQRLITERRDPLRAQMRDLIDMKMDLMTGKITVDSPIEEIQELNKLAFDYASAGAIEDAWLRAVHPKLRSYSYDMEHHVPIGNISLDYREPVTPELVEGLLKFVRATADGRDEVSINLIASNPDNNSYALEVNIHTGDSAVTAGSYGTYYRFGDKTLPLKETLEWVARNLPLGITTDERSSVYPDSDDYS